jgi:hypothetical protein
MSWRRKPTLSDKIAKRIGSLRVEFVSVSSAEPMTTCTTCGELMPEGVCYNCGDGDTATEANGK